MQCLLSLNTNSKKIRIETDKDYLEDCCWYDFKYQFQENKDWNHPIFQMRMGGTHTLNTNSKKIRIETHRLPEKHS